MCPTEIYDIIQVRLLLLARWLKMLLHFYVGPVVSFEFLNNIFIHKVTLFSEPEHDDRKKMGIKVGTILSSVSVVSK